jgi:hypothetical protein
MKKKQTRRSRGLTPRAARMDPEMVAAAMTAAAVALDQAALAQMPPDGVAEVERLEATEPPEGSAEQVRLDELHATYIAMVTPEQLEAELATLLRKADKARLVEEAALAAVRKSSG